jgi:hypothetical protein
MGGRVHEEKIINLYSSHNIIRAHEPCRMKYSRHDEDILIANSYEERRGEIRRSKCNLAMFVVKISSTRTNDVLSLWLFHNHRSSEKHSCSSKTPCCALKIWANS